jgi:uncharacterized membrane protein
MSEGVLDSSRFDRLCIRVLAVEWIVFGLMHFYFYDATVAMIPNFIPVELKPMVALSTGVVEVATGVFILVPRARKWAALSSLILLVLFIPAVYKILIDDSALLLPPFSRTVFRWILVPNNLFLAVCSIRLLQR